MKCPVCGCQNFYVKDPDDEYETYACCVSEGAVCFSQPDNEMPAVDEKTRIFCDTCAWHGCLDDIAEK